MKKKLLSVLMLALSLVIGGDLSVTVSLGEEKITRVKDGDVVVDNAEYLVEGEKLTIYESYMLYLDLGEHVFTVTTDTKEGKFTVKVVNNVVTTFDETDKNYTYGSSGDLVIDADLSTTVPHISLRSKTRSCRRCTARPSSRWSSPTTPRIRLT